MNKKSVGMIILCAISSLILLIGYNYKANKEVKIDKDFSKLDLKNVDKIMFIAHPDDDMIWGGSHLIKNGNEYLVVCITCGAVKMRVDEFNKVMDRVNARRVILGWPDKTNGQKDSWDSSRDGIKKDIESILKLKDWKLVVTHNPEGEYGHIHHKMTNTMVTDLVTNKKNLYYFGKYYKKDDVDTHKDGSTALDKEILETKEDILKDYKSQSFIFDMFGHMFKYEDWLSYDEWYQEKA